MKKFIEPSVSTTEHQRRKFMILVVLSGIVVVLLWVVLIPFSYRKDKNAPVGPVGFFQILGDQLSKGISQVPTTADTE